MVAHISTHLVVENQLKPILDYFRRARNTKVCLYAYITVIDADNKIVDEDVHNRLREMARVFVQYCEMSNIVTERNNRPTLNKGKYCSTKQL
ncbi:hypothetical protein LSPH24S_03176 [Lysinibacillus sphaericus]